MKPGDAVKITGGSLTGQTATLLAWDQHHQLWVVQLWAYLYCRKHHPERLLPEDELLRRRRRLLDERRKEGV